jgi:hypothetical protein
MPQYITIPTSLTAPADGAKVDLSAACEWHRDDSSLPNVLSVDNGEYRVFLLSDAATETAAAAQGPGLDLWGPVTGFLSTTSTATPTFTYANEGMKAGNSLMLVYSGPGGASALVGAETANIGTAIAGVTVNGNAAILRQNNGNGEGLRHWVFQHILTADANTLEIILTLSTAFANHMLTAYTVKNGVFSSVGIGVATSALSALTGAGGNISVAGSADFVTAHRLVGQGSVAWSSDKSGFTEVALSTPNARQRFGKNLNLTTAAPTNPTYTSTGDVASNITLSAIRFVPA